MTIRLQGAQHRPDGQTAWIRIRTCCLNWFVYRLLTTVVGDSCVANIQGDAFNGDVCAPLGLSQADYQVWLELAQQPVQFVDTSPEAAGKLRRQHLVRTTSTRAPDPSAMERARYFPRNIQRMSVKRLEAGNEYSADRWALLQMGAVVHCFVLDTNGRFM